MKPTTRILPALALALGVALSARADVNAQIVCATLGDGRPIACSIRWRVSTSVVLPRDILPTG